MVRQLSSQIILIKTESQITGNELIRIQNQLRHLNTESNLPAEEVPITSACVGDIIISPIHVKLHSISTPIPWQHWQIRYRSQLPEPITLVYAQVFPYISHFCTRVTQLLVYTVTNVTSRQATEQ